MRFARSPLHLLLAAILPAQGQPRLAADFNTAPFDQTVSGTCAAATLGGSIFCLTREAIGVGILSLWRIDPTTAIATRVMEWTSHPYSTDPVELVTHRAGLMFVVETAAHGRELWTSDGTPVGTILLRDIIPGVASSAPAHLAVSPVSPNPIYFSADDGVHGRELWVTDGTTAGTSLAADVWSGANPGMGPDSEVVVGQLGSGASIVLFQGANSRSGVELFELTTTGPVQRTDIGGTSASSRPRDFAWGGGVLMFTADSGIGTEPFVYRPGALTPLTPIDVRAGALSSNPAATIALVRSRTETDFYFSATDGTNGVELWRYRLATAQLSRLDFVAGSGSSNPTPRAFGTNLLVEVRPSATQASLWFSDGTNAGARRLFEDNTSGFMTAAFVVSDNPPRAVFRGGFLGSTQITDGTLAGTFPLQPFGLNDPILGLPLGGGLGLIATSSGLSLIDPAPSTATTAVRAPRGTASADPRLIQELVPGVALYRAFDSAGRRRLVRTDGTPAGTVDLGVTLDPNFFFNDLFVAAPPILGRVPFAALSATGGNELWITDGTVVGTQFVSDINPGPTGSGPRNFTSISGSWAFAATTSGGTGLWRTDGTAAGTTLVRGFGGSSNVFHLFVLNGLLLFTADDGASGFELWRSDGTASGTTLVRDLLPGIAESAPRRFFALPTAPAKALFVGSGPGESDTACFVTDGTTAGSLQLSPFVADDSDHVFWLLPNGTAVFGRGDTHGLWRTDGTQGGTYELVPGWAQPLERLGDRLLFSIRGAQHELWSTDGTVTGTVRVRSFAAPARVGGLGVSSSPGASVLGGAVLFTVAGNAEAGLWRSDGTVAGTWRVSLSTNLRWAYSASGGSTALFVASSSGAGEELFRTDGTGAVLHADIHPGPRNSLPQYPVRSGNRLYFVADDGQTGNEVFVMSLMANSRTYGAGCLGGNGVPRIGARGTPRIGNAQFEVTLERARGRSAAAMLFGFDAGTLPLGGGCALLLRVDRPYASLLAFTDDSGRATVNLPIPANAALEGLEILAQYLVVDSAGSYQSQLAFSDGLAIYVSER